MPIGATLFSGGRGVGKTSFYSIRTPKMLDNRDIIYVLRLITGASYIDAAGALPYYTHGPFCRPVMSLSNLHSTTVRAFCCPPNMEDDMPSYTCSICKQPFKSHNPNPQYCSLKCKGFAQSARLNADLVINLYEQGLTQREIAYRLNVTDTAIEKLFHRLNYKGRKGAKKDQNGAQNDNWKGGKTRHSSGYVLIRKPDHSRANNGYVLEHILIMEQHLGRSLIWFGNEDERTEVVHHINGNKRDNRIENLQVVSPSEHRRLHGRKS